MEIIIPQVLPWIGFILSILIGLYWGVQLGVVYTITSIDLFKKGYMSKLISGKGFYGFLMRYMHRCFVRKIDDSGIVFKGDCIKNDIRIKP